MADAGRVIAGTARGIRLEAPGPGTRPLADRVKQTLFAILEPDLAGARVLDLFAGSGAAGIEALSRGAASATFVEHDAAAARVIAANLGRTRLGGPNAVVVREDALRWLGRRGGEANAAEPFDVVIVDPPYDRHELLQQALEAAGSRPGARRPGRGQALLAGRPAGPDRPASIRARPPLRRDRADVLPAPGGSMRLAVYPGSFDPMTNGHVDVIRRASAVFDRLVVAVLANPRKTPLLPVDTRIGIIRTVLEAEPIDAERFEVASFDGLTVDFCRARGATAIVRGLRAISDFDSEMQLAHNNRVLAPEVDSVFFMTSVENGFVSSSLVKEIASFGGDVSSMVPAAAAEALAKALRSGR